MARPKNLNTNGLFSVFNVGGGDYELRYKGKYVLSCSKSRAALYTERTRYSSWFWKIKRCLDWDSKKYKNGV